MESFLAAIAGHRGDDATAKAQDVMYEAWERNTSRSRIALARKALGISPLCADAYVLLAEEAQSIEEARDLYIPRASKPASWRSGPKVSKSMPATSGAFSKTDNGRFIPSHPVPKNGSLPGLSRDHGAD